MRKLLLAVAVLAIIVLIWYLFIKPYDYRVSFVAKTFPGTINQTVKLWNSTLQNPLPIEQEDVNNFTQRLSMGDSTHIYKWEINPINDSTSQVRVYVKDPNHSLANKIKIPFSETDFEKGAKRNILQFMTNLAEHSSKFKITIIGEDQYYDTYCAYVSLKGTLFQKAAGMMQNYDLFTTVLPDNGVAANGLPFVEITHWDQQTDSIAYNFCFPILQTDNLPVHPDLNYKKFNGKKALKAIYNGNYITSDRAWYALQDYAKQNKLEIEPLPVEFFYSNPNMGGDELGWKAEIYLPLKE